LLIVLVFSTKNQILDGEKKKYISW